MLLDVVKNSRLSFLNSVLNNKLFVLVSSTNLNLLNIH